MNSKTMYLSAIFIVLLLAFAAPFTALASTGTAGLGVVDKPYLNQVTSFTAASASVSVKGGSSTVVALDGSPATGYLVFVLDGVTFSGSQFYLYISKDGLSQISPGDFRFAGPFNVADLSASPPKNVTGGYSIGTFSGHKLVEGPIPTNLSQGNYYIKVYDGSSTSVAVSAPYIKIVPNIVLSPTQGPAGATVTISGYGFTSNGVVNITYSPKVNTSVKFNASATGQFTYSFQAGYLGSPSSPMIYMSSGTLSPANFLTLTVTANDTTSALTASATYNEFYRDFHYIQSYSPAGVLQTPTSGITSTPPWPNATSVNGYVLQAFNVAGDFWNPTANLTFTWDGSPITPVVSSGAPNATGYWWANFTLPVSALGNHNFRVFDANTNMSIIVSIQTTLIVTPNKGTEGTSVTLTGYGFHASKQVTAWWFGSAIAGTVNADTDNMLLYNATTDSLGSFSVTFPVPSNVYGGSHLLEANDSMGTSATASFTVKPSFTASPTTAPLGTTVTITGVGLASGSGTYSSTQFTLVNGQSTGAAPVNYLVTYDNFNTGTTISGNTTGYGTGTVIAAGVPMVHYVGIAQTGTYLPVNVTGTTNEGAAIQAQLQQVLSNQQTILSNLNSLSSAVASNANALSSLQTSVNKVDSDVQSVGSSVSQLSSTVSQGFSSTGSSLSGIQQTLGTLATNSGLQSVSSTLNNVSTFLYVAIALAAIVLILEIVILVRKR
ncbi:MAG: hypothetical protein QXV32_07785 [Conexivisphaerales archaeon]